jgi:hypothetical protein
MRHCSVEGHPGAQLLSARQTVVASSALLLSASACLVSVTDVRARGPSNGCEERVGLAVLASPINPWKRAPLRVLFTTEQPLKGELSLIGPGGKVAAKSAERHGGPPYFWFAEIKSPAAGTWKATLVSENANDECATITREIAVSKTRPPRPHATRKSVWPIRGSWNRKTENLYSAWIEKLFDAPLEETLSWKALHEVLREPSRNILFDHLGLREDQQKLIVRPDCADLPYFLRAYFAFKMGLPFGYSKCTRGGGGKAPRCYKWWNIVKEEPPPAPRRPKKVSGGLFGAFSEPAPPRRQSLRPKGLVPGFGYYLRTTVANGVHSGAGRTAGDDNNTDLYLVGLDEKALRPGTVFADPYGHTLVIAKRIAQTDDAAGVLLAVDAQPDGTVARKRYWRGNFLFADDPALGGPGFKRFRPVVRAGNGALRRLTNAEIAKHPQYGDFSPEQSQIGVEEFYDRMDALISPEPLDPLRAMTEAITALEEQVIARVTSVENGRKFQNRGGKRVAMPEGASIFETTGPWEDFATPARDLRLLIAIDVVRKFPDRVARRPEGYAMPAGKSVIDVKSELESVLASELAARKFDYTRSDGSKWPLTLKDVLDRMQKLEMAYNINDCVEHRWGAPENSKEAATCKRRAPKAQRAKMTEYRAWFIERRRPPRG